jgi:hypothetical protein
MKTVIYLMVISICLLAASSCSTVAAQPTVTATATSLPTATSTPEPTITPSNTPTMTPLPAPTSTPPQEVLHIPTGTPVSAWKGIPIMPNAVSGDGDDKGYSYTVDATPDDVQKYYDKALAKLGWSAFATGKEEGKSVLMFYQKGSEMLSLLAVSDAVDGLTLVMLVKM